MPENAGAGEMTDESSKVAEGATGKKWYETSIKYWENKPSTVDGVLDGYEAVSSTDLNASLRFLDSVLESDPEERMGLGCCLDAGAGIGRVTAGCLLKRFKSVDLLEPVEKHLEEAKVALKDTGADRFHCQGLQDFDPEDQRYDCFWLQWCVLYLTDDDLVTTLSRCKERLRPSGVIVIKENIAEDHFYVDKKDASITRTDGHYKRLFEKSGVRIIKEMVQPDFPPSLYQVNMYALR